MSAILRRYAWGVLIHAADKFVSQRCSYAVEKEAFGDGFYFAFSMCDCICAECAKAEGEPCRMPDKARPAFHSVGRRHLRDGARLRPCPSRPSKTMKKAPNWYSAVFVE